MTLLNDGHRPASPQQIGKKAIHAASNARVTGTQGTSTDFINTAQPEAARAKGSAHIGLLGREGEKIVVIPDSEEAATEKLEKMIKDYAADYPHDKRLEATLEK